MADKSDKSEQARVIRSYAGGVRAVRIGGRAGTERYRELPLSQLPPEAKARVAYRAGLNPEQRGTLDPKTGKRFLTGNVVTPENATQALAHSPTGRFGQVEVRVYGELVPSTRKRKSPEPDTFGNTWQTFHLPRGDIERQLQAQQVRVQAGEMDNAEAMRQFAYDTVGLNYAEVHTVEFRPYQ